ncbi:MAG: ABC transporter substrate-binding protein [Oscillospiraceae bacterium]|nr:ABC transporter substrate-binding protein [Oscillospiraceae bacterium]
MGRRLLSTIMGCLLCIGLLGLSGCGSPSSASVSVSQGAGTKALAGLEYTDSVPLSYAENFTIDHYKGGYTLLTTAMDDKRFLVVPEKGDVPSGLPEDIVVLRRPIQDLYLVASSVMDLFSALDSVDTIRFSGLKEDGWYIADAKNAMAAGKLLYAGKYSQPDYELLLSKGCTLAIENRMISHAPEVLEKLQQFSIPAMIEYSSYESHPLGRVEWVKFFGALLGKEAKAQQIFNEQVSLVEQSSKGETTDKTVAFFFITSNGLVQVRQSNDYVPKMISLAGGRYAFPNLGDSNTKRSTINLQVEEFYQGVKDCDYFIYNSSIDGGIESVASLLQKCPVLKECKAVKEGNVWCTTNDLYQQSLSTGYLISDMHKMLTGGDENTMRYLFHLS